MQESTMTNREAHAIASGMGPEELDQFFKNHNLDSDAPFKKYTIKPYVINWPGQSSKVVATEKEFLQIFGECTVLNADPLIKNSKWVDAEYGYGRQVLKIFDHFLKSDSDILFILTGDATSKNWLEIKESAEKNFEKYNWGIFLPFTDTSSWNNNIFCEIEPNIRLMKNSDGVAWFIHRGVVEYFLFNCLHAFERNILGWGIDIAMTATSWFMKRLVLQDKKYVVNHPKLCGYDRSEAIRQENSSYSNLTTDYGEYAQILRFNNIALAEFIHLEEIKFSLL